MERVSRDERIKLQAMAFDAARSAVNEICRIVPILNDAPDDALDELEADIGDAICALLPDTLPDG